MKLKVVVSSCQMLAPTKPRTEIFEEVNQPEVNALSAAFTTLPCSLLADNASPRTSILNAPSRPVESFIVTS